MVQIMAHSARTFLTPAQQKLAEAACLFDLSEHRLPPLAFSIGKAFRSRRRRSFCASVASAVHQHFRLPLSGAGRVRVRHSRRYRVLRAL